jgi:hypothetical protein
MRWWSCGRGERESGETEAGPAPSTQALALVLRSPSLSPRPLDFPLVSVSLSVVPLGAQLVNPRQVDRAWPADTSANFEPKSENLVHFALRKPSKQGAKVRTLIAFSAR